MVSVCEYDHNLSVIWGLLGYGRGRLMPVAVAKEGDNY